MTAPGPAGWDGHSDVDWEEPDAAEKEYIAWLMSRSTVRTGDEVDMDQVRERSRRDRAEWERLRSGERGR